MGSNVCGASFGYRGTQFFSPWLTILHSESLFKANGCFFTDLYVFTEPRCAFMTTLITDRKRADDFTTENVSEVFTLIESFPNRFPLGNVAILKPFH